MRGVLFLDEDEREKQKRGRGPGVGGSVGDGATLRSSRRRGRWATTRGGGALPSSSLSEGTNKPRARSLASPFRLRHIPPSPSFPPPFSAFRRRYNTSPPIRPIRKTKITCAKFWRRSAGRVRRRELGERGGDGERGGGGRDRGREGGRRV